MSERREFDNPFISEAVDLRESGKQAESFSKALQENLRKLLENLEDGLEQSGESSDQSVYTGTAGIALLYFHLSRVLGSETTQEFQDKALNYVKESVRHLKRHRVSFLCGDPGPVAICSVLYHKMGRRGQAKDLLIKLQKTKSTVISFEDEMADELLYGRVGYLYALMFVQKHMGEACIDKTVIKQVVEAILQSGRSMSRLEGHPCPLMYSWHGKYYLGAAHGISGILYMLMQARDYITPSLMDQLIRPTVDHVVSLSFPSGNFPSSVGNNTDKLVHWCHGAPGLIHMLIMAHQVFGGEKYLAAAVNSAEVVWQRGLLRKGYGLCHGIAGNAYSFLALYRVTKDPIFLYRAEKFAEWCFDYGKHGCRIADRPLSLFEGLAGTVYFLADMLKPEEAAFPAFQLW